MFQQKSILIVEDEPLIAMMLEDFLDSLGHKVVGTCESVEEALTLVDAGGFDIAIVDVQLKEGLTAWPVADLLLEKSKPFILATGGHVDPPPFQHADAPMLAKPYTIDAIESALTKACGF